ncbi:glycosyltransferase family 4 protein [Pontixanthobacter aquaemixtae]|uniref:Glycosyltransferase n=1 Tax=Pontixanthobacter aquaemixtae TaxID=1958940 RepID=A0A844ZRN0_9SPHN|nr:glycosyltransferase family 4 protein [Pontixanthobacter aquaemixtae]MXO89666.1 glycosyltransferase [Pontixanthobacter aquaemixtae]
MSAHDPSLHAPAGKSAHRTNRAADFLFVTRKWAPAMGGMETWSIQLAEHLLARRPIDLIALKGRENGMPPSVFSLLLFPFTVLRRYLTRSESLKAILLGDMALWPLALLAKLRGGKPEILIAAHGTDVAYHRRGGIKGSLYGAYLRLGARLLPASIIIANSRATAEVARETGWTNSEIVPLGTAHCGASYDSSHNGHILFAGRLVHRKGCGWFVNNVLPHLPETIRLQIAGTGWDDSEAHVIEDRRVDYLGCLNPDRLADAYRNALCVIVPNIEPDNGEYEGFGLVAAEAAASGAIVLAADHGGLRDAVLDGTTGHLIGTGDAQAWTDAIEKIAAMPEVQRSEFCREAQTAARDFYNWDRVALAVLKHAGMER